MISRAVSRLISGGFAIAIAMFLFSTAALGREYTTWEYREGRWVQAPRMIPQIPQPEPVLDEAERLLADENLKQAKIVLINWEKTHKHSPSRDRCVFDFAKLYFQKNNRIKSFFYCDELMDEYPESKLFQTALQWQYDIAKAYLDGYKDSFLGMPILDRGGEAVEMMWRIQQRSPGSPLAEKGLLDTADYYFNDRDYDLAEDAYNFYVQNYPNSSRVPAVKLRAAYASWAQFRGTKFDASHIIDAQAQLLVIQREYPELAAEENVQAALDRIDAAFARKLFEEGDFYERTHQLKGAVYQYRFLLETYPGSTDAAEAMVRLRHMPAWALTNPPPPPASGYAPATEPSADAQ
jgi:outer membrane assembly lipoprotein YfiO